MLRIVVVLIIEFDFFIITAFDTTACMQDDLQI